MPSDAGGHHKARKSSTLFICFLLQQPLTSFVVIVAVGAATAVKVIASPAKSQLSELKLTIGSYTRRLCWGHRH